MNLDLLHVPFSRYGSYFGISHFTEGRDRPAGLYLRTVHGDANVKELFFLEVLRDGAPVPYRETATASLLKLEADGGSIELCLVESKVLRVRGTGLAYGLSRGPLRNGRSPPGILAPCPTVPGPSLSTETPDRRTRRQSSG